MDKTSDLVFWGVRGSCPVSGKDHIKYGGHTPSASLKTADGQILVVDAGTGIRRLGEFLENEKKGEPLRLHLFLTHFHLDHIQGLPFFTPLYSAETRLTVYADIEAEETEKQLGNLMGGRFFPISFKETQARKEFKKVPQEGLEIGDCRISFCPLRHPQGSVAYKISSKDKTVVLATDTEHPEKGIDKKLAEFAAGSDIFVYDATFTPAEYEAGKRGWGHSTWLEGTKLAEEAAVGSLYLSHFNPNHSDSQIDGIVTSARERFSRTSGATESE
jgi:phosphoribosyl 1,2-cyclic phosphodiesterase